MHRDFTVELYIQDSEDITSGELSRSQGFCSKEGFLDREVENAYAVEGFEEGSWWSGREGWVASGLG